MPLNDSDRDRRAQALIENLGLGVYEHLPLHVLARMSALVLDEPIVYGEARVELAGPDRRATGEALVFTDSRVVYAVFRDSEGEQEPDQGVSTVDCRTWSRHALLNVGSGGSDFDVNQDWSWYHDWGAAVPAHAQIELRYSGGELIRLPVAPKGSGAKRLDVRQATRRPSS